MVYTVADARGHYKELKGSKTSWPRGQMMCKDVAAHEGADDIRGEGPQGRTKDSTEDLSNPHALPDPFFSGPAPPPIGHVQVGDLGCQDGN